MNGNVELIKILIGLGAELDAKDSVHGWTALMQATFYGQKESTSVLLKVSSFNYRVSHLRIRFLKGLKMSENQHVDKKIRQ